MTDTQLQAINDGNIIGCVLVDFRKAFDLVDHKLLLQKLRHYKTSSPKGNERSPENKQVYLNSFLVSKRFFLLVKGSQLCSPWLTKFRIQSRVVTLLQICKTK